jgi:hypothetical protein
MKRTATIFLTALAVLLCGGYAMSQSKAGGKYVSEGKYFECAIPGGWTRQETAGQSASEKKAYGFEASGPRSPDGIALSVSVYYYGLGNTLYRSAEEFLRLKSKPVAGLQVEGEKYSAVKNVTVAGRAARQFDRTSVEFVPPNLAHSKKIAVFERYAVITARQGFFVLSYYAPMDAAKANIKHYEALLASFKPLVK